jgi:hypothetical protein
LSLGLRRALTGVHRAGKIVIGALLVTLSFGGLALAQLPSPSTPPSSATDDGSNLTVYLLTIGPGKAIWERFGHNAIWIHDAARSSDIAYNWGLFDFDEADFYVRFAGGNMRYWMAGLGFAETIAFYRGADRSIYSQELDLTPSQRRDLRDFVEWNALPQNRYYSYDYFRDNCSTRARDVLDRVLGGVIRSATDRTLTQTTYRSHTRRLVHSEHLLEPGMNFGLGQPADRRITVWEEMFLPMRMRESLRAIRISRPGGATVPLVKREMEIFESTRFPEPSAPPSDLPVYLLIGAAVAALLALLGGIAVHRPSPRAFAVAAGSWNLMTGIGGTVLAALWLLTNHVYSYDNENLLQASPLCLVLAVLLFTAVRKQDDAATSRRAVFTRRLALVIAGLSLLGFLIQLLPAFYQVNGEIIALIMPANVAVALVLFRRRRKET